MIYHNTDYYLYFMAPKFPNCVVINTTNSPKEYGQKLLNRKRGKNKYIILDKRFR